MQDWLTLSLVVNIDFYRIFACLRAIGFKSF